MSAETPITLDIEAIKAVAVAAKAEAIAKGENYRLEFAVLGAVYAAFPALSGKEVTHVEGDRIWFSHPVAMALGIAGSSHYGECKVSSRGRHWRSIRASEVMRKLLKNKIRSFAY